jgi:hypothetical protein
VALRAAHGGGAAGHTVEHGIELPQLAALHLLDLLIDIAPLADGAERVRRYVPQGGATGLFLLLITTQGETTAKARKLWEQAAAAASTSPATRPRGMLAGLPGGAAVGAWGLEAGVPVTARGWG